MCNWKSNYKLVKGKMMTAYIVEKEIASIYSVYATDSERDILIQEAAGITEVAKVSWLKMGSM